MRQGEHKTLHDYHERFKNDMAMMEEVEASFTDTIHIGEIALKNGRTTANSDDVNMATKEAIAVHFMQVLTNTIRLSYKNSIIIT